MSVQVVVMLGSRNWNTIRPDERAALFRVGEHMEHDHDPVVARAGKMMRSLLLFGSSAKGCKEFLEKQDFVVTTKYLNQGE